jgi:hypothetical protein
MEESEGESERERERERERSILMANKQFLNRKKFI